MADFVSSDREAARNSFSSSFEAALAGNPGSVHPGLVGHPLLTPSIQVQILSVVDEAGSATIGDIVVELPGHIDPVGAIFALIAASVLAVQSPGIVDANTIVVRVVEAGPRGGAELHPDTSGPNQSDLREQPLADFGITPASTMGAAVGALPTMLEAVPTKPLHLQIIAGPGDRRADFGSVTCLQRPGVYILLRGTDAYVGFGAEVGARIKNGRQMPGGTPDCIIAMVDAHDGLSTDDAKSLERILWSRVNNDDDYDLVNGVPDGAAIKTDRYDQLTLLAAEIALSLRQADLMFRSGSVREHIAGPRTEPGRLGPPRRLNDLPDGRVMELSCCGLIALAAERDNGAWLLLRGSDVRLATVASANCSASFQRAAWLHAGLLELAEDGSCYVVMRDIVFSSGSAVSHFVSGSKGFGLAAWRPLDEDDAELPAPAL